MGYTFRILIVLRTLQILFGLVAIGIAAYLVNYVNSWNAHFQPRIFWSQFNYLLFTSLWSIVALVYLTLSACRVFDTAFGAHRIAVVVVESLTWIFWLAAWGAFLHLTRHIKSCEGLAACHRVKAAVGISILEWLLFTASLLIAVMELRKPPPPRPIKSAETNTGPASTDGMSDVALEERKNVAIR